VTYVNCGDWVDSCTAAVEFHDGRLEIIHQAAEQPPAQNVALLSMDDRVTALAEVVEYAELDRR